MLCVQTWALRSSRATQTTLECLHRARLLFSRDVGVAGAEGVDICSMPNPEGNRMRSVALKLALSAAFTMIASAAVLTATTKQAHAYYMPSNEIPYAGRPPGVMTVYIHGRNTVNGGDHGADYWNQGDQDLHSSLNYG